MKNKFLHLGTVLIGSATLLSMTVMKSVDQEPWNVPVEYQNLKNPYVNVDDEDRIGLDVYSKYCKFCHGKKGKGDGAQANLVETPVKDFTLDSFKNQSDGSIYYKISIGRGDMTGFEKLIPDEEEMWMLVNYIKNF
ncbi:c-type cytochrome [Maribacter sp. HTCC2170]|uniref:c-type cytochrome n=1 Tax=Maribacter sp. (strain HTCC2170 / KCCM 42371) TaxID=313603 RepID=UPI00006B2269|nr:cytochrome c [Maribacter sp. HTCC2170]EAR00259.1 hypothetical protein FB2170_12596 [Maribacter sp. HTCC2170]